MGKVRSLKLSEGTRVGNYKIIRPLGLGWEGEVYAVQEVPTTAERAMKLFAHDDTTARQVTHTAWFFEQVAPSGSVARYYHMGQCFLDDNEGLFYLVFERLKGAILRNHLANEKKRGSWNEKRALRLLRQITEAIGRVHELDYAVGDLHHENILVTGSANDPRPRFCDLKAGEPDHPNKDFANDVRELTHLAKVILRGVPRTQTTDEATGMIRAATKRPKSPTTFASLAEQMAKW